MKEKEFENYTDPILEECYRIKKELSARFKSVEELSAHLRQVQEECRRNGMKSFRIMCHHRNVRKG